MTASMIRTHRPFLRTALILAIVACACRYSAPGVHPVRPTRSGPYCDSLAEAVRAGTAHPRVDGPFIQGVVLPPDGAPDDLRRHELTIVWTVNTTGRVTLDSTSVPPSSDGRYRRRLFDALARYSFRPAVAEGCAVPSTYSMRMVLR
jgi:hypothetical protein